MLVNFSIENKIRIITWFTVVFSLTVESGDLLGTSISGIIEFEVRFPPNPPADTTKVHICDVTINSPDSS